MVPKVVIELSGGFLTACFTGELFFSVSEKLSQLENVLMILVHRQGPPNSWSVKPFMGLLVMYTKVF
jgi:hypothetical protein